MPKQALTKRARHFIQRHKYVPSKFSFSHIQHHSVISLSTLVSNVEEKFFDLKQQHPQLIANNLYISKTM